MSQNTCVHAVYILHYNRIVSLLICDKRYSLDFTMQTFQVHRPFIYVHVQYMYSTCTFSISSSTTSTYSSTIY